MFSPFLFVIKHSSDFMFYLRLSDDFPINDMELLIPAPYFCDCCESLFSYLLLTFRYLSFFHRDTIRLTANSAQNTALPTVPAFSPGASNFSSRL